MSDQELSELKFLKKQGDKSIRDLKKRQRKDFPFPKRSKILKRSKKQSDNTWKPDVFPNKFPEVGVEEEMDTKFPSPQPLEIPTKLIEEGVDLEDMELSDTPAEKISKMPSEVHGFTKEERRRGEGYGQGYEEWGILQQPPIPTEKYVLEEGVRDEGIPEGEIKKPDLRGVRFPTMMANYKKKKSTKYSGKKKKASAKKKKVAAGLRKAKSDLKVAQRNVKRAQKTLKRAKISFKKAMK